MRSEKVIFARAVILQCFDDRIILEMDWGKSTRPISEREADRIGIRNWLRNKGYDPYMTADEKAFFELPVGKASFQKNELERMDIRCKSSDIILWGLDLREQNDLSQFSVNDNHKVLNICPEHDFTAEAGKCVLRSVDEFNCRKDVEFLWYWRMNQMDARATKGANHHITDMIEHEFGNQYQDALHHIELYTPKVSTSSSDFVVCNLVVRELYRWQIQLLKTITYWRYQAILWMTDKNMKWDEIEAGFQPA